MFRKMLEAATWVWDCEVEFRKKYFNNMLITNRPYMSVSKSVIIEGVYSREFFEYKHKDDLGKPEIIYRLLAEDELAEILKQEIGFDDFDKKFEFCEW